jgi:hypothetical protein
MLIVFGILWILLPFLFIIDLISVILYKKLVWFA